MIEVEEYDTIWFRDWVDSTLTNRTFLDKSFCLPHDVHPNEAKINFGFSDTYYRNVRFPSNVVLGLTKIGGLFAIFQVSLFLTYYH